LFENYDTRTDYDTAVNYFTIYNIYNSTQDGRPNDNYRTVFD